MEKFQKPSNSAYFLNIYRRKECFKRKVYTETKYPFYTQHSLSVSMFSRRTSMRARTRSGCCFYKARNLPLVGLYLHGNSFKDKTLLSSKRKPHFQTYKWSWNDNNLVIRPDGTQNQEELCWQGPAEIYCYATITVCWNVTPCSLADRYITFRMKLLPPTPSGYHATRCSRFQRSAIVLETTSSHPKRCHLHSRRGVNIRSHG
jgi:hypothetical protein